MDELVGRDAEVAAIDRFLDGLRSAPAALVLEGPAGIGKSALWATGLARARSLGIRVLAARPSGAEASFAYQALGDLLELVLDETLVALPAPQRRGLGVALLRATPTQEGTLDAHLVSLATTNALIHLARDGSVLIAVDDAPWLDVASAAALTFAARRLGERRIGVLVTQRATEVGPVPLELDRGLDAERRWLGPLSQGALHALLASRLGLTLPRPTLARLHEMSQGNPFHALEMGRALQRLPALPRPGDPFPIPESLRGLIRERLEPLSGDARHLLLLTATASSPDVHDLSLAMDDEAAAEAALSEAVDAGLVRVDGGRVVFSHPLIASTVLSAAGDAEHRAAHRRLAAITSEPEARGRHLALATTRPASEVADSLEAAALDARRRGATNTAVELYRLAVDRTPAVAVDDRNRRRLLLADALFDDADLPAAREVVRHLIAGLPPCRLRAEARMLDGTIGWYLDRVGGATGIIEAALSDAEGDPVLLGRLHLRLGVFYDYDLPRAYENARKAVTYLAGTDAATSHASAMFQEFATGVSLGYPPDLALFEAALARDAEGDGSDGANSDKSTIPGFWWLAIGEIDRARAWFRDMLDKGREAGEVSAEADLLTRMAETELLADNWALAREYADEARMLAQQEGQENADPARRARALIDIHEGRLEDASTIALDAYSRADANDDHYIAIAYLHSLTLIAHARGDHEEVERLAAELDRRQAVVGCGEPTRMDVAPERIESLVALGRIDDAERILLDLDRRGRVVPRPSVEAAGARSQALVLAARGDLDGAIAATDPAVDARSQRWRRFDRARTLLIRGQVLRQARRPKEAGEALDEALGIFSTLGAAVCAARTSAEIDRLGRRRVGSDDLTPTERRVAELAASGLRNHEVAGELSVSPKTVEAHLARIYAKLGIRSRAELGRAMADVGNLPM